jgi:arginase
VLQALSDERIPLVLGGDHSIAIGSLAGVSTYFAETRGEPIGVMWIDAHADVNTADTTPSGNIHGMSLGVSLGRGDERFVNVLRPRPKVRGENVALVGIRSLDPPERKILADLGAQVFTMRDIDERGMSAVMRDAIKVVTTGTAGIAVQLDMDAIDPNYAPGTGTPVPGGMTYREAHLCMELLADTEQLISLDVVEINPVLGIENQTAELAVGLVQSALGKRIL